MLNRPITSVAIALVLSSGYYPSSSAFTLSMLAGRRGKGSLKRSLDPSYVGNQGTTGNINGGRGQEINGVTMPEKGQIRGWAFGEDKTIACANVDGKFYAIDGRCPRCAFDLYSGKLLVDTDVWGQEPLVACPTCSTTYSFKTGQFGPEFKRSGIAGFVSAWAKAATISSASQSVSAYIITCENGSGKVFCKER